MRPVPSRYIKPEAAISKKAAIAQVGHVSAPLKGLSLSSRLTPGDPLTATILKNFVVEDDRIACRAGYRKISTHASAKPIWHLVPHYGAPQRLAAAVDLKLADATTGVNIKTGFTSNDWHWTSFSNLSAVDYTVMVNGADGVWSWDGSDTSTDPAPVAVTSVSKSTPPAYATCTVAAGDISKFSNGMTVSIKGAAGTGFDDVNGEHVITSVGAPANTFTLVGVDTSTAAAPLTTGVTAEPPGTGMVKETVTASPYDPWINTNQFNIVIGHMNRLFFADSSNLAIYYLPLQSKSGEVTALPLNALFKRGGTIRAMYTWSIDGGQGLDDVLVIFSSNGEAVIYGGVDPDEDFTLVGIYRFDSPMSKHSVVNYGGDLFVLISTGLVPMSTLIRAESEQLGEADKNVVSLFRGESTRHRDQPGWMAFLNPSSQRLWCNIPQGQPNRYVQIVRNMPKPVWMQWEDIPSRCWGWIDPYIYFGDDVGNVYEMHPNHLNDAGNPIDVEVQPAWSLYKTANAKQFKMVRPHIVSDGKVRAYVDFRIDYDFSDPTNIPDITEADLGATWDISPWAITPTEPPDGSYWAGSAQTVNNWSGVATGMGVVGAPRVKARILNCSFAIAGWDVIFEVGSVMA